MEFQQRHLFDLPVKSAQQSTRGEWQGNQAVWVSRRYYNGEPLTGQQPWNWLNKKEKKRTIHSKKEEEGKKKKREYNIIILYTARKTIEERKKKWLLRVRFYIYEMSSSRARLRFFFFE